MLLSGLIAETAAHLSSVLAGNGFAASQGPAVRRALIARVALLDPIIDQAAGELPELLQRRSLLRAAANGLFEVLSGVRILETHLRYLPEDEAARKRPRSWRNCRPAGRRDAGPPPKRGDAGSRKQPLGRPPDGRLEDGRSVPAPDRRWNCRRYLGCGRQPTDCTRRIPVESGTSPLPAAWSPTDLPALINALRAFIGVGAVIVFWIETAWPNGPQAVIFTAVTILVFSPMADRSVKAAVGQGVGTLISAILVAILKFGVLVNKETFLAFALVISVGLVPLAALSSVPLLAPYFIPATLNFIPLLAPSNEMTFDTVSYLNTALALLTGCAAGGLALLLIPPLPPGIQSQRLVDSSIRDLRRMAKGRRNWTLHDRQGRLYARMIAMPEAAEPVQRSYLVTTLSVGIQVIRLGRIAAHGPIGVELAQMRESLAAGDIGRLESALRRLDEDITAVPNTVPGTRARVRARAALLAIGEAVRSHREYFESNPS